MKFIGIDNMSLADITSVTAGTGLSGGGTAGDITLDVDASIPEITTLAGLTSFGAAGATTNIVAGDLTMYNNVVDGNPSISLGSSATERLGITANYEASSAGKLLQTVNFATVTSSSTASYGKYVFNVDGTDIAQIDDYGLKVVGSDLGLRSFDTRGSSTDRTVGGRLVLAANDGAAMGSTHNLGTIEFSGAEDASGTLTVGARISARTDATWSASENGGSLTFWTTDGNASESLALSLDSNKKATFSGKVDIGTDGAEIKNVTTSSATQGGKLILSADDEATMGSGHRLGVIEFKGAENGSGSMQIGARIESITDATWEAEVENGASLKFYTTDGAASESVALTLDSDNLATFAGNIKSVNTTTSSATEGGELNLISDDGAALGDDHRLGKIGFQAAEDGSNTIFQGASIQAFADAAWSGSENGTRLEFYTADGDGSKELSLTLDSDLLATFAGAVTVTGALTGTLATAAQGNVTSLGTLTALDVDDINLNDKRLIITGDTDDTFSIVTGAAGATTLTTTDTAATAGHFEVAADGDIILDSAGQIKLEPVAGNNILLDGTVTVDGGSVTGITTLGVDSVSLTAVQTSAESFVDNDTSIMTSAAIADKIQTNNVVFINHLAFVDADDMSGDDWVFPYDSRGVEYYRYTDLTDTVANEATSFTLPRASQHKGIIVPYACTLQGFYGAMSSQTNHRGALALWVYTPAWGVGGSTGVTATRRFYAAGDLDGATSSYATRPAKVYALDGSSANVDTPIALSAGDAILPSLVCPVDGETTDLKCSFTIVLKITHI